MLGPAKKRPGDTLDYDIDFTDWLADGDNVLSATAAVTSGTVVVDQVNVYTPTVKVWLSGGAAGETASVVVTATTSSTPARIKEIVLSVRVSDC